MSLQFFLKKHLLSQLKIDNRYKESYWLPKRRYATLQQKFELDQQD